MKTLQISCLGDSLGNYWRCSKIVVKYRGEDAGDRPTSLFPFLASPLQSAPTSLF
jgi:hypothetical protein